MVKNTLHKTKCMCCGKPFSIDVSTAKHVNMTAYSECPFCGYEHVVEIRNNQVVFIRHS